MNFQFNNIRVIWLLAIFLSCKSEKGARNLRLLAHWKLQYDAKDYSGNNHDGINHSVVFSSDSGAYFNGRHAFIEIPDDKSLDFEENDFSLSAWVKVDPGTRVGGDILNKFDSDNRKGFNFHILSSSSAYNGVCDTRNIFFGIDNSVEGKWVDCGRPAETNDLITFFVVYKNQLYTGIAGTTDPVGASRVFRYDGDGKWTDCGRISDDLRTPSIMGGIIHQGELFIGTGNWDYQRQEIAGNNARVYKYIGDKIWKPYGKFPTGKKRIHSIASYKNTLYVNDDTGETQRYDKDSDSWLLEHKLLNYKLISAGIYDDQLFNGSKNQIYRLKQNNYWDTVGDFYMGFVSQTHTFETYEGRLYAGTWPNGQILRYEYDTVWTDCGWVGTDDKSLTEPILPNVITHRNEVMELTVYNGKMYAGVIPLGEVWRYDGEGKATLIKRLVHNPKYSVHVHDSWCRVPAMAIYKGKLFAGTGTARGFPENNDPVETGKVFRWEAGSSTTFDDDIGTEWRHIAAIRQNNEVKIYLDGKLVSISTFDKKNSFNLSNGKPLLIGFGMQNYFKGRIKDVKIYGGALSDEQVSTLFTNPGTVSFLLTK